MSPTCQCGHSIEEHGHDPEFPSSTACHECDCIAFEAVEEDYEDNRNIITGEPE